MFAVFAFSRLLSAVPVTPGGVGVIDLGYIGGLAAAAPRRRAAAVVGAVLVFRALTYGVQIPLGAFTYLIWQVEERLAQRPRQARSNGSPGGVAGCEIAPRAMSRLTISLTRAAEPSAMPLPSSTPVTTSENQCAAR